MPPPRARRRLPADPPTRKPTTSNGATTGSYSAWSPDLPGCVAAGGTLDEVQQRIREAIEFHLAGLRLDGIAIPRPSAVATVVIPVPAA
ncbi:MAG: type II toxin-antitoxin system HicB family antitoxin [Actinomycetes bacterium]